MNNLPESIFVSPSHAGVSSLFGLSDNEARAVSATRNANGLPMYIDLAVVGGPRTDKPAGSYDRGNGV